MHSIAAVEVHALPDGTAPVDFLRTAYCAGRRGRIALILRNISPGLVDEALDPLVRCMRPNIPGLVYVDGSDHAAIEQALQDADMAFSGVDQPAAQEMLDRIARPTSLAEMNGQG